MYEQGEIPHVYPARRNKGHAPCKSPRPVIQATHPPGAFHLRQKAGDNTTSTVKISSRPISMAMVHTQVWRSSSTA
ncbi:MAG: hypothetical protein H6R11_1163 [Proteobacteria bacterium]|nr:hypothetical protein [Pseudomonadota bacterium]